MEPPYLPEVGREMGPITAGQYKLGRQYPDKIDGESGGPKDLIHLLRKRTVPWVVHGVRSPALPEAAAGGGTGVE